MIEPGHTIGILGGGQLGRMIATAAAEMGYLVHIFCQRDDEPAAQVAARTTVAAWDDAAALDAFANACDVVTLEFENVPITALERVQQHVAVHPGAHVLHLAQHRGREKRACTDAGAPTAPFVVVDSADELASAVADFDFDVVIKTCRFGYDGKGQARVSSSDAFDAATCWQALLGEHAALGGEQLAAADEGRLIVEKCIAFSCEISVIAARGTAPHEVVVFPPALNHHRDGILRTSSVPAPISPAITARALEIGRMLAEAFDVVGLLAVELFVVGDPQDDASTLLVNEVAPRPHNSGHWSQDGCMTSQFTQLVRAICGLPLGDVRVLAPTTMENLIGDEVCALGRFVQNPAAAIHIYGKDAVKAGRKMGHVNVRDVEPSA